YNVVITGICSPSVTSNNASLTVTPAPIVCTTVCAGNAVSFSVPVLTPGLTYQWRKGTVNLVNGDNIFGANSPVLTINPVNITDASQNYNVLTTGSCLPYDASTIVCLTVNPMSSITISGQVSACENSIGNVYTTLAGMAGYSWTVSSGGIITWGGGTNQIQVVWNAPGIQSVSVNYTNFFGCTQGIPTVLNVTVDPMPGSAGNINGITTVCGGTQGVNYSTTPIANAVNYVWTLPVGATIINGAGTSNITVNFAANASSGNISVYGNNLCGNGSTADLAITLTAIPATPVVTINGTILSSSAPTGNQWYFQGTMIPGATSQTYQATQAGWYSTIVTINNCTSSTSNSINVLMVGQQELMKAEVNIYPVPNDGSFTVSITSESEETFSISVFTNMGVQILEVKGIHVNGHFEQFIDLRPVPNGIYNVAIRNSNYKLVKKIVVTK
ncbi:MAG: T9SS type A sorting domain-containing protein, partial [Bacteroidales bacterium]